MASLPLLEDCDFCTETTDKGLFVGRVRQFPNLRSRPYPKAMDAIDEIMSKTRDRLARLNEQAARSRPQS